jgi:nucleoside-diphosphate-sugar epimerase
MRVAIAGAHGQIAMRLTRRLVARGDTVVGLIRNPDHSAEVEAAGAHAVLCDLERATVAEVADAVAGCDGAVFAAGAGPGSGAERKLTVDRDGAIKLLDATAEARARYVIVSSIGAEDPPSGDDVFAVYLRAKAEADAAVTASDREWTVVRPGRLTNDPGTGQARIETTPFQGDVSRDDVAEVLALVLHDPRAAGHILYVNDGSEPIEQALESALRSPS